MADETKTTEQLIAEVEALKKQLEQPISAPVKPGSAADATPVVSTPRTRRGMLSWITPVILSLGTVAKVGTARAASTDDFVEVPIPTSSPSLSRTGHCVPIPTASPAAAPTAKQ